jgi:hypothetical protein
MRRVVFAVLWTFVLTFVFLILCCVVAGVVSAITLQGGPEQNKAVIDEASRKWALPMFFGSLLAALVLSAWGVLPGTRRRPAVTSGPGLSADPDFPPARPVIALPVGTPEDPPPELAVLGPPLRVHGPGSVASMSGFARFVTFVLGLLLLAAPVAVIDAVGHDQLPQSARKVLVIGGIVGSLMSLVIAVLPRSPYSYQVHHDALVVSNRKTMRIVPWNQIQALIPAVPFFKDLTVVTRDGQKLPIKAGTRDYLQLFNLVFVRVRDHLLPLMVKKAHAGGMVEFGPLGVSSYALRYKGATTPWQEVTQLVIVRGSGVRKLMVYHRSGLGLWPFIQLNLNKVPNDLLLIELLRQIAPPTLLVPDQARW